MLQAEEIQANWKQFLSNIELYIQSPRKERLLNLYNQLEDQIVLAPASSKESYHNAFAGGYVDHVNRVVDFALKTYKLWEFESSAINFTVEELVFAAINHDLGKIGMPGVPNYVENESEWHRKNQGLMYKNNPQLPFSSIPDRSLYLLQHAGIQVTWNEHLAIKLHDGMYEEANKPYLMAFNPEARLRTNLPIILHHADMMASRIEWENHYLPKLDGTGPKQEIKAKTLSKPQASSEAMARVSAKNPGLMAALQNL